HRDSGWNEDCWSPQKPVGASLLANAVCQSKKVVDVRTNRWQASSHRDSGWNEDCWSPQKPVGASLLANAVCQSKKAVDVPTESLASQLPQGFGVE
ncbi:hypothetical protein, partial [Pseudomonas atacamensis]|uniref:hypothetical protein n=1 Tax=Pseudomonas atacamensis TaxID=2565368 RepID=UPI0037FA426C